jgi:hypothetical protein
LIGEPHVCDSSGKELPPGMVGTLYFSGEQELAAQLIADL